MKKILIILLILELSIPAYAKKKNQNCELKIGVGQEEVKACAGKPDRVVTDYDSADTWIYENIKDINCESCSKFGYGEGKMLLVVKFNNSAEVKSFSYSAARRQK